MKIKRGLEPKLARTATISIAQGSGWDDEEHVNDVEPFCSHTELAIASHTELFGDRSSRTTGEGTSADTEKDSLPLPRIDEAEVLDRLLHLANALEIQARRIILDKLDPGSRPRLLLQADTNIMRRSVRQMALDPEVVADPIPDRPDDLQAIQ